MKLIWHIARKDLTRLRLPLLLWCALHLWEIAIGYRLLHPPATAIGSTSWFLAQASYADLVLILKGVLTYFMVSFLAHEDPLIGTSEFWLTRPISGLRLLAAKAAAAAILFAIVPILISIPWWLTCHFGAAEAMVAAIVLLEHQVPLVVVALAVASLTPGVARYVGATLFGVILWVGGFGAALKPRPNVFEKIPFSAEASDSWITSLLVIGLATCLLVIVHQYTTRRLWRSLAIAGAYFIYMVVASSLRPLDVEGFLERATWLVPTVDSPCDFDVALKEAHTFSVSVYKKDAPGSHTEAHSFAWARVQLQPARALGNIQASYSANWTWTDRDGRHTAATPALMTRQGPVPPNSYRSREQYNYTRKKSPPQVRSSWSYDLISFLYFPKDEGLCLWWEIPNGLDEALAHGAAECTLVPDKAFYETLESPEIPLAPGGSFTADSVALTVESAGYSPKEDAIDVEIVGSSPAPNTVRYWGQSGRRAWVTLKTPGGAPWGAQVGRGSTRIEGVYIGWDQFHYRKPTPRTFVKDHWEDLPVAGDWFKGAQLFMSVTCERAPVRRGIPLGHVTATHLDFADDP